MEESILPPSPNWFLSQVLDCSWDDRLAYGALMHIVVIDPADSSNPIVISNAHGDRISSVSFSPKGFGNYLLSTCSKGLSIIWNLDTQKALSYHKKHKGHMTYGSWSRASENLVVCGDEDGGLSWWDVKSNILNFSKFAGHIFSVVACCPHQKELVAVGTKQGTTLLISLKGKGFILQKVSDHNSDITSIVWCPAIGNPFRPNNHPGEFLLCSACRGNSVHFWRVGKELHCEARLDIPIAQKVPANYINWSCLCWPHPSLLLASVSRGEVLSLNIAEYVKSRGGQLIGRAANRDKKVNWQQVFVSAKHSRGLVTVHCYPWKCSGESNNVDAEMKNSDCTGLVWTSGADRIVYALSLNGGKEDKINIKLNTINGTVHALAVSPIDGHSMAIGLADKAVRLVNLSEPSLCNVKSLHMKHVTKVMALAWHPEKEDWLACGTSDGHVDVYSTLTQKVRLSFQQHSKESIYVLQWGPLVLLSPAAEEETTVKLPEEIGCVSKAIQLVLYAVGGGKIALFDPDKSRNPNLKPLDPLQAVLSEDVISIKKTSKFTDLSWKPDFSMLAVGNDKGSVLLFYLSSLQTLQFLVCVTEHVNLIQDLAWHPQSCASDLLEDSPYSNWLATASNDVKIRVLDVTLASDAIKNCKDNSEISDVKVPCIATLQGHRMRVAKVSWSPHESGRLLSASYDQCVQVWDVVKQLPLACFVNHGSPVLTCLWSPVKADLALSGSMDATLRIWKVNNQDQKLPVEKKTESKQHLKNAAEVELLVGEESAKKAIFASETLCSKCKNRKEKSVLPLSGQAINDDSLNAAIIHHLLQMTEEECLENKSGSKKPPINFGFFGDEEAMAELLSAEQEENRSTSSWDSALIVDTWRGSIKEAIEEAIKNKHISDFHVSMAPMVSSKMWLETCAAYAEQLKAKKEFSKASSFLLATHKVEEAIKFLAESGRFRHALAIARSRLPPDDPSIQELIRAWGQESINQGKLGVGAVCLAASGQWNDAARLLVRKQNPSRLLLAAKMMASKGEDKSTSLLYARECFLLSLKARDWDTSKTVLQAFPDLGHFALLLHLHHSLSSFLIKKSTVEEWLRCSILKNDQNGTGNLSSESKEDVLLGFESIHLSPALVSSLKENLMNISTETKEDSLWLAVSSRIALSVALAPSLFPSVNSNIMYDCSSYDKESSIKESLSYVVQAMALVYNHHIIVPHSNTQSLLCKLCRWLFWNDDFESNKLLSKPFNPLQESIRAYVAAAVIFWLGNGESRDVEVLSRALKLIDDFKADLFSDQSVKWFKVDFKHKLLQSQKVKKEPSQDEPKQDVVESVQGNSEVETLGSDSNQENNSQSGESSSNSETELERLTLWLQEFEEKRGKVPNPYLCYGQLIHFLKNSFKTLDEAKASSLLSSFEEFWHEVESQANNIVI